MSVGNEIDKFRGLQEDGETAQFLAELKALNYISHAALVACIRGGLPRIDVYLLANRVPVMLGEKQDREIAKIYELNLGFAEPKWNKFVIHVNPPLSPANYTPEKFQEEMESMCQQSRYPMVYVIRNISDTPLPEGKS